MRLLLHYFNSTQKRLIAFLCSVCVVILGIAIAWQTNSSQALSQRILVVLDAGHQANTNAGAVSGYYEGNQMYKLAVYEKAALERYGFDVILTRDANSSPSLTARGYMAVQYSSGYDIVIFMSDHTNAASASASGVVACTSKYLSNENRNFINTVMDAVATEMNKVTGITYNRHEIMTRDYTEVDSALDWYGVIRGSVNYARSAAQAQSGPVQYSFIMEHGFHTNYTECSYLMSDANLQNLAQAKAQAFADYFNRKASGSTSASSGNAVSSTSSLTGTVINVGSGDVLNVRSLANPYQNNIIDTLRNGTSVTILNQTTSTDNHTWYQIRTSSGTVGYVNSSYIRTGAYQSFVGAISSGSLVAVETSPGSGTCISGWPYLANTNLVDVIGEGISSMGVSYYKIRIANQYVGYVPTANLIRR